MKSSLRGMTGKVIKSLLLPKGVFYWEEKKNKKDAENGAVKKAGIRDSGREL
ncbi:hypothetical protein HMP0721_1178 [Pseudoramibacter alactolyticus ATCC 23263]|uniref:Uncharacterized protein n=1 Tax=Pseudoramibacter alactolyticus ATCC 23263 TaxID=887929 RepID=E6MGP5_9FIRM|nr:hypothetical protein HMP0721_1178 [Pseudoramibacter alactolyticus ATCC 23263]